jgi:hypothetical protein
VVLITESAARSKPAQRISGKMLAPAPPLEYQSGNPGVAKHSGLL